MHLKLGKSFPVLKFRPNILQPLNFTNLDISLITFNINDQILTFNDLIKLDFIISQTITQIKQLIQQYIRCISQENSIKLLQTRKLLKQKLGVMLQIIEKLEFENIEKDINQLFTGNNGLFALFQYVWSSDILILLFRLKESFQSNKVDKQVDTQILIYSKSCQKYYEAIQQVLHKQAKFILKEFVKQLYIIPQNWSRKLAKQSNLPQKISHIITSEQNFQQKLSKLLKIYYNSIYQDEIIQYKYALTGLIYLQIEQNFYAYITFLKAILLNKVTGVFIGDYETWGQLYEISLKIYSRKQSARMKNGIEIDQIIEHQFQDLQFTNFLMKNNLQTITLQNINFYFKNCPKTTQNNLRPIVFKKIKNIIQKCQFKQYQDIKQYLQTQALPNEKKQIICLIRFLLQSLLHKNICKQNYFQIQKGIPRLFQFLIKNPEYFYEFITQKLLNQMLITIQNSPKQQQPQHRQKILFIYEFINTMLIQSFEEQFDFNKNSEQFCSFASFIKQILLQLKASHGLQVHQDGISIVSQWIKNKKNNNKTDSCSQDSEQQQDLEVDMFEVQFSGQVANLMLISGRDCDFKLQKSFKSSAKKQLISNQITSMFQTLSDSLFKQRSQIQKLIQNKRLRTTQENKYLQSCLAMKGFKDKLLNQNIMSLALKIHPTINFSQISTYAVEFLTFFTPIMIDDPVSMGSEQQCLNIQPFDVCDIVSGEEPIQSMKLIYKKITQFDENFFDFDTLNKLPLNWLKSVGNCNNGRAQLITKLVQSEEEISIFTLDRFQQFRKFLFYCELMTKIFNKLNQKSQKGIKQIKIIYTNMQKICFKIWDQLKNKIISSQIYSVCEHHEKFKQSIAKMKGFSTNEELKDQALQFSQINFKNMVKNVKLPYIDSILSKNNYITKTCQQLICGIGKVLHPNSFSLQYQKLFNPLDIVKIQQISKLQNISTNFKQNYQFIGQIIRFLAMIQFTCCSEEAQQAKERQQYKEWSAKWRKNCKQLSQSLLAKINSKFSQLNGKQNKNIQINVFLVHLKAQIIKILIPILVKDPLKNTIQNPKTYNAQLQQTFCIFSTLCQIIQKISPGQEQHLMTFLQIFQNFETGSSKNTQANTKISQFLYQAIQCLLDLAFKGIRVRSYHFYKFIKSYLKFSKEKQSYMFFNSVISHYFQSLMKQIVPQFKLPQSILNLCDQNMNNAIKTNINPLKQKSNKQVLINQGNLKKSYNKIRYLKFIRFQPQFNCTAQKICIISMFINLFCRLNFKSLTQGIEKIWETKQMHIVYLIYLQKIVQQVSVEFQKTDQKLLDIINVDCFGNLSIILRNSLNCGRTKPKSKQTQFTHNLLYNILTLIQKVLQYNTSQKIKNSLTIPVKKIMQQLKSTQTSIQTIDYISQIIQNLNISKQQPLSSHLQQIKIKHKEIDIDIEQANFECATAEILDMILTCYNIKLAKGINSNVHFTNVLYLCWDSQMKARVIENNTGCMQKRMGKKVLKQLTNKYAKNQQKQIKLKIRRPSIKTNNIQQTKQEKYRQFPSQLFINISEHSQQLFQKIIQNFVESFNHFCQNKQNKINQNIKQQNQQKIYQKYNTQNLSNLFTNLKILSLVTINNPQIINYLLNYKSSYENITVYDMMIKSATQSLPVFVQLYMMFMKTNCGFCTILNEKSKQKQVLPINLSLQYKIKSDLLTQLQQLLNLKQTSISYKLSNILKSINFLTKLSASSSKPYFRTYKFGSINNKLYWQIRTEKDQQYFINLVQILKNGISKISNRQDYNCIKILAVYEQALNRILKPSDLAWMKLHQDIQLKQPNNKQQIQLQLQLQLQLQNKQNTKSQQTKPNKLTNQYIKIPYTIKTQTSQSNHQINSLIRYDFQVQILDQQIYSILTQLQNDIQQNDKNQKIMKLMIEYSGKHSVWEDLCQSQNILSYNRQISFTNSQRSSHPPNTLSANQNNIPIIQPIISNTNSIVQSQPDLSQSNQISQINTNITVSSQQFTEKQQQQKLQEQQQQQQQQQQQYNRFATPKKHKKQSIQQYLCENYEKYNPKQQQQCDQIVQNCDEQLQNDYIVQNSFGDVDQIKQCMSQTSLKFLSQHSVKLIQQQQQQIKMISNTQQQQQKQQQQQQQQQICKHQLLLLYQQSTINPQAYKQLLNAITIASVLQLQKFIANQAVDQQIQMLVIRQLWGRGIMPSTTSISKNSRYYGNMVSGIRGGIDLLANNGNLNGNGIGRCINLYINQATGYKRMYQQYKNRIKNTSDMNLTQKYIPQLSKQAIQHIFLTYFITQKQKQLNKSTSLDMWKIIKKISLDSKNMYKIVQICLNYLNLSDSQIQDKIINYSKLLSNNNQNSNNNVNVSGKIVKLTIIDSIFAGCIRERIGIRILFLGYWDYQLKKVICPQQQQQKQQQIPQIKILVPILQVILKQSHILNQTINSSLQNQSSVQNVNNFIHVLWEYFNNCDQFKAHSKLQNNTTIEKASYPYYQMQQSLKISENIIRKIIDKMFTCRTTIGWIDTDKKKATHDKKQLQKKQELLMILFYLDPTCFQTYFKIIIEKISNKLSQIIKKQHKILTNFQSSWDSIKQNYMQMEKQQKYWNLRQSKKSTDQFQQNLQFFRNILVDISINLLPKYKKIRFNYHCGKNYRQWKLQIQILKQKLLTYGSVQGLVQLQQKQKQLEEWRRNQSNQIINQQILPIVQQNSEQFLKILMEAEQFISEFLQTFSIKQQKQKIVIYNTCAKIYEILLASQILTHEQKQTYHSMSKLKTTQSIQSTNNIYGNHNERRKSRIQPNRKSVRLSINSSVPKVSNLLKKIGPNCTFLSVYIGLQQPIRQLHAKYSDVNKRLKILWGNQMQNRQHNTQPSKQKIIECRRNNIIQDTLSQIDQDFINLPIKIKFQGQIGIDYGGVTRQWITLFMKQIINPELGLFQLSANKLTFQPHRNSRVIPNHLRYFRKIGILVGKALKQNWLLQVNLTKSFLKHILGNTLYVEDLQDIDPQTTKSLKWILENDIGIDDSLGLNFTYQVHKLDKKQIVQLIPNGANLIVTQQNKKKYVKLIANLKMTEQIREQSKAFMNGLESVIPYSTLSLFSYKQISLYLSGMPTIDIKQMQQSARYQNLTPQCQQVVWFWSIIAEWSQQQLANFLFFLTGSFKVPYGGFKQHPIGFNKMPSCNDYLPVAHTCFSVVDISTYSNKQKMARLLKKSIKQGKGFSVS